MTYNETCSSCKGEAYWIIGGNLTPCEKCRGWGEMEVEAEISLWDGKRFVDVFYDQKEAEMAMVGLAHPHFKVQYLEYNLNNKWNFGESLNEFNTKVG